MAGALAHRDQENLIHSHQTAAASKPQNQSVHGLAPKTPSAKVPLKASAVGKVTGRRNNEDENVSFRGGKAGNGEKNAFVTPSAPRDQRAPLGAKTTNAKAKAFQTPAQPLPTNLQRPQQKSQQRNTTRKPKLQVHQQPTAAEAESSFSLKQPSPKAAPAALTDVAADPLTRDILEEDGSEPEIEYCPPKPIELPDEPDFPELEFNEDRQFPQFEPQNYFRGVFRHFLDKTDPIGEDGLRKSERKEEEKMKALEAKIEREMERRAEKAFDLDWDVMQDPPTESEDERDGNGPGIATSKRAVQALSGTDNVPASGSKTASAPALSHFAAPTAASKAKKSLQVAPPAAKPVSHRLPGTAASRNTIGYAQGRKVSSSLRDNKPQNSPSTQHGKHKEAGKKSDHSKLMDDLLSRRDEEDRFDSFEDVDFGSGGQSLDDLFREQDLEEVLLEVPRFDE